MVTLLPAPVEGWWGPLAPAEYPLEEELSSLNSSQKLPPPYYIQNILKQMKNVNTSPKNRDK